MADPLEALRGAQSIRDPYAKAPWDNPNQWVQGAMPMPPIAGMGNALAQAGGKVIPTATRALKGLLGASEGASGEAAALGQHLPEFTQVGGEAGFNAGRVGSNIARNPAINPASENAFNTYANQAGPKSFVKPSAMPEPPLPPPFKQVNTTPVLQGKPNNMAVNELIGELKGNLNQIPRGTRLSSEAGKLDITPEQMVVGGAGAGLAAYGATQIPKAYQGLKNWASNLNQQYNPFAQFNKAIK